jgi:CelD/BcsL family acetyltransferase involved in cellulose biosynthesis
MVKFVGSDFTLSHFSPAVRSEYIQEVMHQLSNYLANDRWSIMHIGPISGLYAHGETLKKAIGETFGRRHHLILEDEEDQTYFQLYDSWEDYLKSLSRRQRQHIKEKYRRLRKVFGNDASITVRFAENDTFEQFFDAFVTAHQDRWEKEGRPGHFRDWPDSREFHCEVAHEQLNHNRLRLLEVKAGDHLLGYKYAYKFADKYLEFLDARSEEETSLSVSLGQIIFCEQLKEATTERVRCIDSMRGEYDHKKRMGGKVFSMRSFYIIPKKPRILIPVMVFRFFACLLNLCYYRVWYNKAAVKLPLKRKGLWKIWIRTCDFARRK